jgi:hypothetical protein
MRSPDLIGEESDHLLDFFIVLFAFPMQNLYGMRLSGIQVYIKQIKLLLLCKIFLYCKLNLQIC